MIVASIVGARPQFIKCAAVSKEIREHFHEILIHTGQHYDYEMSKSFFNELKISQPDYNLGIGSGLQCWQIGMMMIKLEEIILDKKPDLIIVYGDANSTAAASIVAAKSNIPLAHIEAGLREFKKNIPEEINKLITDILSDFYFCPTETAVSNLKNMGIEKNVFKVGDVTLDIIYNNLKRIEENKSVLKKYNLEEKDYYFMTCHRASNTNNIEHLKQILSVLKDIDGQIIFPLHPRTSKAIKQNGLEKILNIGNLIVTSPTGYFETQTLIKHAKMVLTDSGGVIKEAYFYKTPTIILDMQTEWVETVSEGWSYIAGPNRERILNRIRNFKIPDFHSNCLGDGKASEKIVKILIKEL
ncbi:UDP-N-acetylglucosamine 2-epimerase (non-hydrolyzing) [candidate division KSB1 bacterium]|nr:UDP-N-acetylglucosamine 2-epimerase (non-hydrolyzing) [candidate division KSB1 bacterium]